MEILRHHSMTGRQTFADINVNKLTSGYLSFGC